MLTFSLLVVAFTAGCLVTAIVFVRWDRRIMDVVDARCRLADQKLVDACEMQGVTLRLRVDAERYQREAAADRAAAARLYLKADLIARRARLDEAAIVPESIVRH